MTAAVGAAHAQSAASSDGWISYAFSLDPNSPGVASNLTVSDGGLTTYNLNNSSPAAFVGTTGSGTATAIITSDTGFSLPNWNGYADIGTTAQVPGGGMAVGSVGSSETVHLLNTGLSAIVLDITAFAAVDGSISYTGLPSATNFAAAVQYVGFSAENVTTSTRIDTDYVEGQVSPSGPNGYTYTSSWSNPYSDFFVASYALTVPSGDAVNLSFYSVGESAAETPFATPTPPGAAVFTIGLLGLAARRRPGGPRLE